MTLFDGKPLTESEVAARAICKCGAPAAAHMDVSTDSLWELSHNRFHLLRPQAACDPEESTGGGDCDFDPREFCYRTGCTKFREHLRA